MRRGMRMFIKKRVILSLALSASLLVGGTASAESEIITEPSATDVGIFRDIGEPLPLPPNPFLPGQDPVSVASPGDPLVARVHTMSPIGGAGLEGPVTIHIEAPDGTGETHDLFTNMQGIADFNFTAPSMEGTYTVTAYFHGTVRDTFRGTVQFQPSEGSATFTVGLPPPPPPVVRVDIDIKSGSDPNSINLRSRGVVPVAILGGPTRQPGGQIINLSVETLDAERIRIMDAAKFDPDDPDRRFPIGAQAIRSALEDVNGDEHLDLVLFFNTQDLATDGLFDGATTAARVYGPAGPGNLRISGVDGVNVVR